ncbi:Adenylosuccinate synthetase [Phytophthora palmivora]|uniref:Adenylosuccinate synthetase n=1 Tax=Phytophthora palmivora TaxID=4796 RepID=A0A2P4YGU4_9STRA|nr:Adenylosuccinate synthetase [Phytophthora palmivora]
MPVISSFDNSYQVFTLRFTRMARGKRLRDSERAMIVNAYNFFLKGHQEDNKVSGRTRELVHQCLGTPTSTIGAVWRSHQAREYSDSSEIHEGGQGVMKMKACHQQ